MLHIRLYHGSTGFSSVGLIDSGATTTFIPSDFAEILGLDLTEKPRDATGAGGTFSTVKSKIDRIFLYKGKNSIVDSFENIPVEVPVNPDAIPYVVLGRDQLFRKFDITFEERYQKVILKRH